MLKLFSRKKNKFDTSHSEQLIRDYFASHEEKKLQIGSGENNLMEGWLNTDLICRNKRVAFLDAGEKFPFPQNTFQFIYSEHIFEHLTFHQALNMLKECYRVLKPGGVLRMATPNFDFLMGLYQNPNLPVHKEYISWATKSFVKNMAKSLDDSEYSPVYVINNFFRDWGHQIIHNFDSIRTMMAKEKFENIHQCEIYKSSYPELSCLEKHGESIPKAFNELETLVIEATKPIK